MRFHVCMHGVDFMFMIYQTLNLFVRRILCLVWDLLDYIKIFYATVGASDSSHHVTYASQLSKEI